MKMIDIIVGVVGLGVAVLIFYVGYMVGREQVRDIKDKYIELYNNRNYNLKAYNDDLDEDNKELRDEIRHLRHNLMQESMKKKEDKLYNLYLKYYDGNDILKSSIDDVEEVTFDIDTGKMIVNTKDKREYYFSDVYYYNKEPMEEDKKSFTSSPEKIFYGDWQKKED